MSEQPQLADLLREASERMAEAVDKLDAAQLVAQQRQENVVEKMRAAVKAFVELGDAIEERVK